MKALLMFRTRDFDLRQELPWNEQDLVQDLELTTLFNAMASGDEFLLDVARKAVVTGMSNDRETILYRQDILRDCLKHPSTVRAMYDLAVESIEGEKKSFWGFFTKHPDTILYRSRDVMQIFLHTLQKLRAIADEQADNFESPGFRTLFTTLARELDDAYFDTVRKQLHALEFREGTLISARLGTGNKGTEYVLHRLQETHHGWFRRFFPRKPSPYSFVIADRDEAGARALSNLKDRGINLVANALAQSTDHILSFYKQLRTELGFYIGCLNLHTQLNAIGESVCFPVPEAHNERRYTCADLYDPCLCLSMQQKVVGNEMSGDGKDLVIITGANRGGKSTFLRSVGVAQLMMQCGSFVSASRFRANMCTGIFTHFRREEDPDMKSGKFDEELARMSRIVDDLEPDCIVLFNESFAATNDREGSEIAGQITRALLKKRIKVLFVTHQYEFARGFYEERAGNVIFLRAERHTDGSRTFKLVEAEPLQTSFGADLYARIFARPG